MLSFNELFTNSNQLNEKLIMINNGANYGQVVILAGGAGSGKGFAISQYLEGNKFKIRDVDEWKKLSQRLSILSRRYKPETIIDKYGNKLSEKDKELVQKLVISKNLTLDKLDLRNPQHVYILHILVDAIGLKDRTLDLLLSDALEKSEKGILDNIMFDITAKNITSIEKIVPTLLKVGYKPKNIHIVWVLTDYTVAVKQNSTRDRVVPDDILLQTHEGAALTMNKITRNGYVPNGIDGGIYVVLGGAGNTIVYTEKDREASTKDELKSIDGSGGDKIVVKSLEKDKQSGRQKKIVVIKDFNYLQLKKPGKAFDKNNKVVQAKLYQWVLDNIPKTDLTRHLWPK